MTNLSRAAASRAPRQYEFPTGYNTWFGAERYYVGEQFFNHSPQMSVSRAIIHCLHYPKSETVGLQSLFA